MRYRLYVTADGWVFLANAGPTTTGKRWPAPSISTSHCATTTMPSRRSSTKRFLAAVAGAWEARLTAIDIACVEVVDGPVEKVVMVAGGMGETLGIVTPMTHALLDDYPRLTPTVRLSRSAGVAGPAPLCGAHTDAVLSELGYRADRIVALREAGVLGG